MYLSDLNFLAILVAAIVNFIIGAIWYTALFGKLWATEHGFAPDSMKCSPTHYVGAFIVSFIMAWVLALFAYWFDAQNAFDGAEIGFFSWLGFIATTHFSGVIWARKPFKAYLIDTGCLLVGLIVMGAIIGAWK